MTSEFGKNIRTAISGESHGPSVGVVVTGLPPGEAVDLEALQRFLDRRAPGRSALTTARKETDVPRVTSGLEQGRTTGGPLCISFANSDTHSSDYETIRSVPRPNHADYTGRLRYGQEIDLRGGGHFSGRLTAPLCAAGGIALQILERAGIRVGAHLVQAGTTKDRSWTETQPCEADFEGILKNELPVLDPAAGEAMKQEILAAKAELDSLGGAVECAVLGLPGGLGSPMFEGVENVLAQALFGIPAVKAVEFGTGRGFAALRGSQANDAFCIRDGAVRTVTNHCGGILGGITSGMPLVFTVTFKPTPSIGKPQQSVDLRSMTETVLTITGRHDPCIAVRAVPAVEAAAALCVLDLMMEKDRIREAETFGGRQTDDGPETGTAKACGMEALRAEIDTINRGMAELFCRRMEVSARIAEYKREHGLPISDPQREQEILDRISAQAGGELAQYAREMFRTLFEVSKDYQRARTAEAPRAVRKGQPKKGESPEGAPRTETAGGAEETSLGDGIGRSRGGCS